ncbi:MAG: DNA ligase D [Acidobacteria bacterium]|nr:DNA ligase D [Acidobacteriota bacterium]
MSLKEYAHKRTFEKTPEPAPQPPRAISGNSFCVQRHHATRLHYDFRMEIGGVLVSWAVPKGPSMTAGTKQLAMHVEDHPLDYGGFEGNIPKGNYGAGSVMLWDRGAYELVGELPARDQIARGDLKFRLHGQKLKGEFALVLMKGRGKGNEWLLLKKKDSFADPSWDLEAHARSVLTGRTQEEIAREMPAAVAPEAPQAAKTQRVLPSGAVPAPMPRSIEPMKATLADALPRDPGWIFEIKWDGVRAICFLDRGNLRIDSRSGNPCERQYPELSVLPHYVDAETAVLDGEIAVLDERGRPSFSLIQPRIMASDPNAIANLARARPAALFLFDLLYLDGQDLRGAPLNERKRLLRQILKPTPAIRLSEDFEDGQTLFEAAREQGLEGVVAKRAGSPYECRRSANWLKRKTTYQEDFVICGYTRDKRDYFGSLVLAEYQKGELVYVGNVGTGFNEKTLVEIYRRLQPLETAESPLSGGPRIPKTVVWVKPELVCAVKFVEWTREHRLRAPVYLGLRLDIHARETEQAPARGPRPALLGGVQEQVILPIDGTRVKFTNLNKVFYPREGYTKRDLVNYYDAVSEYILPHLEGRPLSLKRYPDGIDGPYFFQKDSPVSFPSWLRFEQVFSEHNQAPIRFVLAQDRASLLYLANLGCIDQNPWMSRAGSLETPDFILIDLDPYECSYDRIVEAAQLVKEKLDRIGLCGYPKTTGGDGMHIYIPLAPLYSYEQSKTFAEILGTIIAGERPDLFTTPRSVAKREKGKVYFDYLQNGHGKTIAAPYVLRAHPGAPVSTPLDWSEVARGLAPQQFHIRNAPERFARLGDLFARVLTGGQRIEPALERLEGLLRAR